MGKEWMVASSKFNNNPGKMNKFDRAQIGLQHVGIY